MLTNRRREVSRSSLAWLAVVWAVSACGSEESSVAAPVATAAPVNDGRQVEDVSATPSATEANTASPVEPLMLGSTDTAAAPPAATPESVDVAALDGAAGDEAAAPGDGAETPAPADTEGELVVQPPACSLAHAGGVFNLQLTSGGREREYRLFVPNSYDGATRLPVMFNLHGTGGTAAGQAEDSGLERLAQEEGFIVLGLQGFQNAWNVLLTDPNQVDDVQYASDVLDDALQQVCVDERRVYSTGFSGGARMSSRLACNLGDRIAAIAPVSGIRWTAPCSGRAVPIVTFHGLADPQNTYAGMARPDEWIESVEDALAGWADHNGCADVRAETPEVNGVSVYSYGNCADGADVVLYRIAGLGHTWAKNEIDATRAMWTFLEQHALP